MNCPNGCTEEMMAWAGDWPEYLYRGGMLEMSYKFYVEYQCVTCGYLARDFGHGNLVVVHEGNLQNI